jgi:2-methylcitrate dehydratase PrpD
MSHGGRLRMGTAQEVGLTEAFARFAVTMDASSAPPVAFELARFALVDTVGVIIAGAATNTVAALLASLANEVGSGRATVLPTRQRANPRVAALINATAGHALDYDDATYISYGHPSVVLLPALLAAGEASGATGQDLADAYIIGLSLLYALADGIDINAHYHRGWHATGTVGVIATTAAVSRLLGSSAEQTRNALGIAGSLAAGSRRNFGTMTKPLHAGIAASNAVFAANLAAHGFTADAHQLEAPYGFMALYGQDEAAPGRTVERLERDPWSFVQDPPHLKLYPCCFNTHRGIASALTLARAHPLSAEEISVVRVVVEPRGLAPLISRRPVTGLEAKFSMEYVVSAAIVDKQINFLTFVDATVERRDLQTLLTRVKVSEADQPLLGGYPFADVEVTLSDGSVLHDRTELRPTPDLNVRREDLFAKFTDCVNYANSGWSQSELAQQLWFMQSARSIQFDAEGG